MLVLLNKLLMKNDMSLAKGAVSSIGETAVDGVLLLLDKLLIAVAMAMFLFLPDFALMCYALVLSARPHESSGNVVHFMLATPSCMLPHNIRHLSACRELR